MINSLEQKLPKFASRELITSNESANQVLFESIQHNFTQMQSFVRDLNLKVMECQSNIKLGLGKSSNQTALKTSNVIEKDLLHGMDNDD
jgi:hypothetical protein